jgi:hypothetical protein
MDRLKTWKATSLGLLCLGLLAVGLTLAIASPVAAQDGKKATRCRLHFNLSGWSFIYRTSEGTGRIECEDGQKLNVKITAHGGGLTLGTEEVKNAKGVFSGTFDVKTLLGTYVEIGAHGGVGDGAAGGARAMFKGSKRLSLSGGGGGISAGIAMGGFTIAAQ